jgi:protein disulfide-isomerase
MRRITLSILMLICCSAIAWASEGWGTDFAKAKALSAKNNLPILIDFTGSDWCGWCIKLDKEVFSKKEFKAYAAKNLNLFMADFPNSKKQSAAEKKQNKELAEKYGIKGYPTILLVDKKGTELARTGYKAGGPEAYVKHLQDLLASKK